MAAPVVAELRRPPNFLRAFGSIRPSPVDNVRGVSHRRRLQRSDVPDYVLAAYVLGRRFRVMSAVLTQLHICGLVEAGRGGTVCLPREPKGLPRGFERVIWSAIHGNVAPGALLTRPSVDTAMNDLRRLALSERLVARGWPSSFPLFRRREGRALVSGLRSTTPLERSDSADGGLLVALYGEAGLQLTDPVFAAASGLLTRSSSDMIGPADVPAPPDNVDWWSAGGGGR